jgi:hypothetical protein
MMWKRRKNVRLFWCGLFQGQAGLSLVKTGDLHCKGSESEERMMMLSDRIIRQLGRIEGRNQDGTTGRLLRLTCAFV